MATFSGMAIEGKATVSRAKEPIVDEADSSNDAARTRVSVCSCSGNEGGDCGAPSNESSWCEKVNRAGRITSLVRMD